MALFNIVNIESKLSLGNASTKVAVFNLGGGDKSGKDSKLTVPWRDLQDDPDPSSILSWHTRVSLFSGRTKEMAELEAWANSEQAVSIKFITGDGGVGKSRLAAEFATMLGENHWSAGFLDLRKPQSISMTRAGTLFIIDYPEEEQKNVSEFLRDLSTVDNKNRLRVLFLTRQSMDQWNELIHDCKVHDHVATKQLILNQMEDDDSYTLYCDTLEQIKSILKTSPPPLSKKAFIAWLELDHKNRTHHRALFIVALATYSATHPKEVVVDYSGSEVMEALCERELERLRNLAKSQNLEDKYAIPRLLALSAFMERLTTARLNDFDENELELLGFPPKTNVTKLLQEAGLIANGVVLTPQPDIFAAAFVSMVLGENTSKAPEIIWLGIETDIEGGLERLARLSYDAEIVLGILENRISVLFAEALRGDVERCKILDDIFSEGKLPLGWIETAVIVGQTILKYETDEVERARLFNNLSNNLYYSGDIPGALEAIQQAMEIRTRLAQANPARFEPDLAMSLNNLSNTLSDSGDIPGALVAIQQAVEIRTRLAQANPALFEPKLALSLNNLSTMLSDSGNISGALEAIQQAVEIYTRLAQANPARFEPELAASLNTLSNRLSNSGDIPGALEAIQQAVEIRTRLAQANPARFEPDLALSLNNLSNRLSNSGDITGALGAIQQAVEIYTRLAQANPARFEPELASSLNNLSTMLSDSGNIPAALQAIQQAVDIYSRLALANPTRFEPGLANSYWAYGLILQAAGKREEACKVFKMGLELIRPYAEQYPNSWFGEIQKGLEKAMEAKLSN